MTFKYENQKYQKGFTHVIGCDEVGRGCLAGPVVAAAVVFDGSKIKDQGLKIKEIKDSKLLTASKREELSENIKLYAKAWSIAEVSSEDVDRINIHNASLLAMRKAVEGLEEKICRGTTQLALDGKFIIPEFNIEQESIIGGDNKVLSIAAASIIAKVYRDNLMREYHRQYPIYDFQQHKGYATLFHRTIIKQHGLSPIHRLTFCGNFI